MPVAALDGLIVHVPFRGFFGVEAVPASDLKTQAVAAARHLSGDAREPFLAGYCSAQPALALVALSLSLTKPARPLLVLCVYGV